jgi:hypothetical protein
MKAAQPHTAEVGCGHVNNCRWRFAQWMVDALDAGEER